MTLYLSPLIFYICRQSSKLVYSIKLPHWKQSLQSFNVTVPRRTQHSHCAERCNV